MKIECKINHGIKNDMAGRTLIPGEFAIDLENRKLLFCFEEGKMESLKIDESVSKEKADELIEKIIWFIKNNFTVHTRRFEE